MIEGSGEKVANGRAIAQKTAQPLQAIVESVQQSSDLVSMD